MLPEDRHLEGALQQTRAALGLAAAVPLAPAEASVFLKYLLLESLDPKGGPSLFRRLHERVDRWRPEMKALLCAEPLRRLDPELLRACLAPHSSYRHRLVELSAAARLSAPLAPEVCLEPRPLSAGQLAARLPGERHHVVVFAEGALITHELYPLVADAFVGDSARGGRAHFNVLGAAAHWLDPRGRLERILYFDLELGRFGEGDLSLPLAPHSAQFLCLGRLERALHAACSQRLRCVQANPAAAARRADDKAATLASWAALGLRVPAFERLTPGTSARAFLARHRAIAAKPNRGTEGENVAFFSRETPGVEAALRRHLERCWKSGDAMVQERCDGICFRHPASGRLHSLALRLNLASGGGRHHLESGWAQVGPSARAPAARGRGGRILPLEQVAGALARRNGAPVSLAPAALEALYARAEEAASVFGELLVVGLDVLLDAGEDGGITPVFLEANPRPGGLAHARFLRGPERDRPGVSARMWEGLEALIRSRAPG